MGSVGYLSLCWVIKLNFFHLHPPIRFGLLEVRLVRIRRHQERGLPPKDLRCHPGTLSSPEVGGRDVLIAAFQLEFHYRRRSPRQKHLPSPRRAPLLLRGTEDMCRLGET